jgi:hypothetical protein
MRAFLQRHWRGASAALALVALAAAFAGDFVHTDDGCQVETHCLACQRVLVSVGVEAVSHPWGPSLRALDRLAPADIAPAPALDAPIAAGRAPPLA